MIGLLLGLYLLPGDFRGQEVRVCFAQGMLSGLTLGVSFASLCFGVDWRIGGRALMCNLEGEGWRTDLLATGDCLRMFVCIGDCRILCL